MAIWNKTVLWLSDTHLNFLRPAERKDFFERLESRGPYDFILSGDIADGSTLEETLIHLGKTGRKVYFVLGNHDFYHSSMMNVRETVRYLSEKFENLIWLSEKDPIALTNDIGIVGHDGWPDGAYGATDGTEEGLNDFQLIAELAGLEGERRLNAMRSLGREAAEIVERQLLKAVERFEIIFIITHVPPFQELIRPRPNNERDLTPYFSAKYMGDAIRKVAKKFQNTEFIVLCGHTHELMDQNIETNIRALCAGVEYGKPGCQRYITTARFSNQVRIYFGRVIRRNRIQCSSCHGIADSKWRHNLSRCPCGGVGVDGGLQSLGRIRSMNHSYLELSEFEDGTKAGKNAETKSILHFLDS